MCERSLILNVCLIALVSTNPIPQRADVQIYPGTYCDQSVFTNSLIGSFSGEQANDKSQTTLICPNYQSDILLKMLSDTLTSNPKLVEIMNNIQHKNNADILNLQNPSNTPNVVNNYIILPPDLKNIQSSNINDDIYSECMLDSPICTRVKKNADINQDGPEKNKSYHRTDVEVIREEESDIFTDNNQNTSDMKVTNTKKGSKQPKQANNESKNSRLDNQNIDSIDLLVTDGGYQRVNKTKKSKIKKNETTHSKEEPKKIEAERNSTRISKKRKIEDETPAKGQKINKSTKPTTSKKKINGITLKHGDQVNRKSKVLTDGVQKKKSKELKTNKNDSKYTQKGSESSRTRNNLNQDFQFPNMPYDSNSMYKYINAIMSNYQLGNNDYKKDYPFNFNNFYQLPQLSSSRNNKKQNRSKSYKRRKHPKFYKRRNNRKRVNSRRKQVDTNVFSETIDAFKRAPNKLNETMPTKSLEIKESPYLTVVNNDNETVIILENVLTQINNNSSEEYDKENTMASIFNESFINNSLPEETYNSFPSFIVGIDGKMPIIFENSILDDYYPDFTADEALQLTTEESQPVKYNDDKYHYVSNKKINFGDFIKKRKQIALKNMSKNSNFFFSDTEGTKNVTSSQEDKGVKDKMSNRMSPHFLDNPDFRTRKIDSNEIYEPYHHHNIYQDPEEDYNKYEIEDTAIVYSTPISAKNNMKYKSCNDIEDGLAKWRKSRDSNVETVYARSKLAKYGLAL